MNRTWFVALTCLYAASGGATDQNRPDKGWITHNMAGNCAMLRAASLLAPVEWKDVLTVQVLSDPNDKLGLHQGQLMFSLVLFEDKFGTKNHEVQSFEILAGQDDLSARFKIIPISEHGLSFLLGSQAEAALEFLREERTVRATYKSGVTVLFRVPTKGYELSRVMFDVCAAKMAENA